MDEARRVSKREAANQSKSKRAQVSIECHRHNIIENVPGGNRTHI
jgi:hypothetical protein